MKREISMEQLLRWRLTLAETEAPPAPSAGHLLALTRPWWEVWPEKFQALLPRVSRIQLLYGHAMADPNPARGGHLVPALLVRGTEETELLARLLYFNVRAGRLRLRFQFEDTTTVNEPTLEVTFVSDKAVRPLLAAPANRSVDHEYRVDTELPEDVARLWTPLKVTDRMPFRLILRVEPAV